jgi:alkylation response protein AidB-like acyl-CoA dehydrogenase
VSNQTLVPLRTAVRAVVRDALQAGRFTPQCDSWHTGWDEGFTRTLASHGWIGMTLPARYGGHGRSPVERHVVLEELLAAGAPLAAHWAADRQMGQSLLRFGTEEQRARFLPAIARGECYFAIGMSEPDSGSDLASVRTTATASDGGWILNGRKLWVTGAHHAHAIMVLARTSPLDTTQRHEGFSQFVVLTDSPGLTIRPILSLAGDHHFNELLFNDVFVPGDLLLGKAGDGWHQVTAELAFERSGPERFMSTYPLMAHLVQVARECGIEPAAGNLGSILVRFEALRQLSLAVAGSLANGVAADIPAALVKEMGTRLEGDVVDVAREILNVEPDPDSDDKSARLLGEATLQRPGFTIRGGTSEILRGVVARGIGLR